MKVIAYIVLILLVSQGLLSCSSHKEEETIKWEYKVLDINGHDLGNFYSRMTPTPIHIQSQLDSLGNEGWELVDVYTYVETVHPNFGNEKYVVGIQPNTRTQGVSYVFKRIKKADDKRPSTPKGENSSNQK